MKIESFTIRVTDDCNYDCTYCYQHKRKAYIDLPSVKKALRFFSPYFQNPCSINFYGGEPLLAFASISQILGYIERSMDPRCEVNYSMTTNGSLLTEEYLEILERYNFKLILSFDGLAQDFSRKKGSFYRMIEIVKKIRKYPHIDFMTHSVFMPDTVRYLSETMKLFIHLGVESMNFNLSYIMPWGHEDLSRFKEELIGLTEFAAKIYDSNLPVQIIPFRRIEKCGIPVCTGGRDQMALNPDNSLWGCDLFYDYGYWMNDKAISDKYCFGSLDYFIRSHEEIYPKILRNYSSLTLSECRSEAKPCLRCYDLLECFVCPLAAAFGSHELGKIPDWVCAIRRILNEANISFWEQVGATSR